MPHSVATLLTRNLFDVFGESDPKRRRAAIDEIFAEDCVFFDPKSGAHRGRDEIERVAAALRAMQPDFEYRPQPPEDHGEVGRIRWVEGRPGEPPTVAGTDFIIARGGQIAEVHLFFDELP